MSEQDDAGSNDAQAARAAGFEEGRKVGLEEGRQAAVTAERARIRGILDCEEAKGREAIARKLAFTTAETVDVAKAFLSDLPKSEAAAGAPSVASLPVEVPALRRIDGASPSAWAR